MKPRNVVAILQARISGGTRLPGVKKVLVDICGQALIERQMARMKRAKLIDRIVVAIPDTPENDELAEFCESKRWACFRGPEDDVLKRYAMAARKYKADPVMRVTADCPLIDPGVLDGLVTYFLRGWEFVAGGFDYASNNLERTFPHGLDCEIFTAKALREIDRAATEPYDREHVTEALRRLQDRPYKLGNLRFPIETVDKATMAVLLASRWTVDFPEDLELVRRIYEELGDEFTTADVVALLLRKPELMAINEQRAIDHGQAITGRFEPVSEDDVALENLRREHALKASRVTLQ